MNFFKESPRDARSTTTAGIRARIGRTLSMALAVAITAILLPAAISLAKTGSLGSIPVVEAITGTSASSGEDSGATHTRRRHSTPAAEQAAQQSGDPVTIADSDLPTLKDDKAVAGRLSNGGSHTQRSHKRDDSSADDNGGTRHDPSGDDASADDSIDSSDDGTADQGSGDVADTTPADDNGQSSDDTPKQDDNPSSDDTSSDDHGDHGKGNDDSGKKDTPKPSAKPAPVATIPPAETAPSDTGDTTTDTSTAGTTPASDTPADASTAVPADTRRQFTLDPTESASLIVNVPQGADHITLWARAAGADCAPRVAVTVDGEPSDDFTLAGTDWQPHVITPVPDAGVHVVRVLSLGTDSQDPQVSCADDTQDVFTIAEPRVGTDGDNPPAGSGTIPAATDTSAATDATTDDGTADQGSGDAAGTTPSDSSTGADDGTPDQGSGDAAGTTPSDSSTGADDGTPDQGTGDATGDTSATTTDSRRQYSLYTRESVTLVADEATDGGKLTMWLRTSSEQCELRVIVSVDDRIQKIIGVNHADWQKEDVDYQADGSTHRIAIGVLRPKGGNCAGTESLTIVEPKAGEEGATTPALPVTPAPDTTTAPDTSSTDGTTPSNGGGNGSGSTTVAPLPSGAGQLLWGSDFESGDPNQIYKTVRKEGSGESGSDVISTDEARTGTHSLKITLPAAAAAGTVGRYQLVANMPDGKNGDERWYGFSVYIGDDWNLGQVVDDRSYFLNGIGFRYTGTPVNGPGSNVEGNTVNGVTMLGTGTNLANTVGATDTGRQNLGPLEKGKWMDFVYHIKWSTGSDGFREEWRDGVKMGRYNGATLGTNSGFEYRMGYYEGVKVDQTRTMYVDNNRIGTSFAAVDPSR